jgi:hypothetical protein
MTKSNRLLPGPQLGYVCVFSASNWKRVEGAVRKKLPDRARKLISIATLNLTLWLPVEKNAPKVGGKKLDVLDEMKKLIDQAESLRRKLYPAHYWSEEYRTSETSCRLDRRLGMELDLIDGDSENESSIFRICLTGLIESGVKFLRRTDEHTTREGNAWDAWVVWITLIAKAFKLPPGIRVSDVYRPDKHGVPPEKPAPFVELIKALQAIACPDYRRSSTDGGLTKAIVRARKLINIPESIYIGGTVDADELERQLLRTFGIEKFDQLNARELPPLAQAVGMVIGDTRPGIHPFIPEPPYSLPA